MAEQIHDFMLFSLAMVAGCGVLIVGWLIYDAISYVRRLRREKRAAEERNMIEMTQEKYDAIIKELIG